jgi:hypothetical protein
VREGLYLEFMQAPHWREQLVEAFGDDQPAWRHSNCIDMYCCEEGDKLQQR